MGAIQVDQTPGLDRRGGIAPDGGHLLAHRGLLDTGFQLIQRGGDKTLLTVIIHEGRNRIVRRMFDAIGHPVRRLSRTSIGPVRVGTLAVGEIRELSRDELGTLLDMVKM